MRDNLVTSSPRFLSIALVSFHRESGQEGMENAIANPENTLDAWRFQTVIVSAFSVVSFSIVAPENVHLATLTESWYDSLVRAP